MRFGQEIQTLLRQSPPAINRQGKRLARGKQEISPGSIWPVGPPSTVIDVHSPWTTFVPMSHEPIWVGWGRDLQAIAQTGLHFSESEYDRERYRKILEISIEIVAHYSGESLALIRGLFENQSGYATPKVDVRGLVFRDDKLLLVQERSDGLWTLPGG
jgi:hypothetical protein